MAGARKDHKGRVLLKGESYREAERRTIVERQNGRD